MAKKIMITIFFLAVVTLDCSVATPIRNRRQLPCGHPLRISAPQYFTHCNNGISSTSSPGLGISCTYSQWGEWEVVSGSNRSVPTSRCPSGETFTERRNRSISSPPYDSRRCSNTTQTRQVCSPDAADRLILALNLGGSGQDYSSLHPRGPNSRPGARPPQSRPRPQPIQPQVNTGGGGQVPQPIQLQVNTLYDSRGRLIDVDSANSGPGTGGGFSNFALPPPPAPAPPSVVRTLSSAAHVPRNSTAHLKFLARRQTIRGPGTRCPRHNSNHEQICQHITGKRSIVYAEEFANKKVVAAPLVQNELALDQDILPFNYEEHAHRFRRQIRPENCGSDDIQNVLFVLDSSGSIGRGSYNRMKQAVAKLTPLFCKKVKFALMTFSSSLNLEFCFDCFENNYPGRNAAANAIKAASYQHRMTYTGEAVRCICEDLLSGTCGISSNPSCLDVVFITDGRSNGRHDVCNEVRCLHRRTGINTYAIGINGFDPAELNCIADGSDRLSAFEFRSFNDFEQAIEDVIGRLVQQIPTSPRSCAALNGPTRAIPLPPRAPGIQIDPNAGIPIN